VDRSFALPLPRRLPAPTLPRGRMRMALIGVLAALPLLGAGWLWLRNSPLAAVEHVHVSGAHGNEAHAIDVALREAATHMSTLNVNVGALQTAVAPFRVVRDLQVSAHFPHSLSIRVIEQPPVAALVVNGVKTAVAADGVVLGPDLLSGSLPTVPGAAGDPLGSGHVHSAAALAALAVMGAAPAALVRWVARVYTGREGLTVAMRNGLQLYFGDASRPHAKWLAAMRVLADPSSAGATYIDVRLPERAAAGVGHGVAGEGGATTGSTPTQVSASDPTAAALAATLAEAVNGGAGASSGASATGASAIGTGATGATAATGTESSSLAGSTATPAAPGGVQAGSTEAATQTSPDSAAATGGPVATGAPTSATGTPTATAEPPAASTSPATSGPGG
jgi:cell division protein FtsQ